MDVNSLYTNINTTEGLQAVSNIFSKYPDSSRPDQELLQLLKINLTRNDFEFNDKYYLQVKGTAMGKKFAPAYANIFIAEWEEKALFKAHQKPAHYYRFLDDIWGVWTNTKEEFYSFVDLLNGINTSITVKTVIHPTSIDFLDTTIYKGPDFAQTSRLCTKVFFKATDSHALLYKTSYHPKHVFKSIIKSQLLRFHRICTSIEDFKEATQVLFHSLSSRGYSRSFLRKALRNFLDPSQEKPPPSLTLPLVMDYSTSAIQLARKIRANLHDHTQEAGFLSNHRLVVAYRRRKNLKDLLVSAKVPSLTSFPVKEQANQFISQARWVRARGTRQVFPTQSNIRPSLKNCVYLITCSVCRKQYVGETGNSLSTRFYQYKYNILRQQNTTIPVIEHFILHGWRAVETVVLANNPHWTTRQRRQQELRWIQILNTVQPGGLNEKRL